MASDTPLYHRMVSLMACTFTMTACYALGVMSHFIVPLVVGLIFLGALFACLIAFLYSLIALRVREPGPVHPLPRPTFDYVVFDSVPTRLARREG